MYLHYTTVINGHRDCFGNDPKYSPLLAQSRALPALVHLATLQASVSQKKSLSQTRSAAARLFPAVVARRLAINYSCSSSAPFLIGAIIPAWQIYRHNISVLAPDLGSSFYLHQ